VQGVYCSHHHRHHVHPLCCMEREKLPLTLTGLLSCNTFTVLPVLVSLDCCTCTVGMLNGSRKTGNRFLIRWPVCKVRNRLSKSFINVLCIYILIISINDFYCLRVSADTDAPAAITINSNLTRRLKHMVRVSVWTDCDYK